METTLLLSKALGLYFLVTSLGMLFRGQHVLEYSRDVLNHPAAQIVSAVFTLIFGAFLVAAHNVWVTEWPVLITIIAWLAFIKGAVRFWYPEFDQSLLQIVQHRATYYTLTIINLIMGVFLCYQGFVV